MSAGGRLAAVAGVALAALAGLVGCQTPRTPQVSPVTDPVAINDRDLRVSIKAELEDEVLMSYERDEPPEIETAMLDPRIGPVRIGVGPGDLLIGRELARAPSRWPLDVDPRTPTEARSKRLEINLSQDGSAAWVFDEISWRIGMCGRTAVIPLRMTALFARDGDRWVQVFEHLSFGRIPAPSRDGQLRGAAIKTAVSSTDLVDELSGVLAQGLFRPQRNTSVVSVGPEVIVLGPELGDEWHANDVLVSSLPTYALRAEERRVGTVGRTPGSSTIAYWAGNFVASVPARGGVAAGKVRMRGTFVFERRRLVKVDVEHARTTPKTASPELERKSCATDDTNCRWVLVQGHVSQPIDDGPDPSGERRDVADLATLIFGTALISPKPLEVTCDDGSPAPAPARPSAGR
ncbi:MAG: nuclear transport factor 2 family protein [Kofleriaceae bacterium]